MGFLKLTNGVPSGDTIRRVLEAVSPDQLRTSLAVSRENIISSLKGSHVIVDGKKLRGENPASKGCNGLYLLNAMVSECEICVAELRVGDKTNELTALPTRPPFAWSEPLSLSMPWAHTVTSRGKSSCRMVTT